MENDLNYYQPSYHQAGPPGPMKHSSSADPYQRPRPIPGGTGPAGAPMSHPPSHHSAYPSSQGDSIGYGSRAQTTGPPLRKPVMDNVGSTGSGGLPPSMLRDYQYEHSNQYDENKKPASQSHSSNMGGYPSRSSSYLHDEPSSHPSKYDIHSASAIGRAHVGYPSEDVPVSKLPSYSGAGSGMPHSSRDTTINSFERDLARELEPPMRERSSIPPVSTLEKYFSSEEIKRFNEYNRFLVMSSPGRQKKFYNSLTTAEFNRFCDFVDVDTKSKITASFKAAPPPPIPSAVAPPPPIPSTYDGHNPAYPSAYSFSSSFYDEDKLSSGSGPGGHRSSALLHSKPKYSTSSGSPPPSIAQYLKGGLPPYGGFTESSYERVPIREIASGMARFADLPVRKELPHELAGHSRSSLVERSSTGYPRSSGSGYQRSRSRSRSVSPESRSRSSRYARHGSPSRRDESSSHYSSHRDYRDVSSSSRDRERERDRDRERERDRDRDRDRDRELDRKRERDRSESHRSESHTHSRVRSRSPGSRDYSYHTRTTSSSTRDNKDSRDYSQNNTSNNNNSRKLAPKEEHYYLLDALTKVKKIHKLKLEELDEIKKRDNDKSDSYIYKKVASSVKDIEERIATVERQLEANRKVLGDNYVEVEKTYEEKEKEKKTSTKKSPEEAVAAKTKLTDSSESQLPEIKKPVSGNSSGTSAVKANSSPSKNELTKDASSTSIVSSASNIEATAETVAKLPKIPKLSAKKSHADAEDLEEATKEPTPSRVTIDTTSSKESTSSSKDTTKSTSTKTAASKSTLKPESKARTEPSASSSKSIKTDSKESSKPSTSSSSSSSTRYGPITEEEIDKVLPFYQWCSMCKNFFESTDEFITHLHRDAHLNGLRTSDFLIIKRAEEKLDAHMLKEEKNQPQQSSLTLNGTDKATANEANNAIETLGTEFLYPSKAFYCDLCAKFLYTTQQTEMHLHSDKHLTLYKKYLQKNKEYEVKMASQRKSTFRYSYLMRTLIRMKEKGEDIVARVSQEMVRRTRAKEKEREKSERDRENEDESGKRRKSEPQPSGSGSGDSETKQAVLDSDAEKSDNGDEKVVKKEEEFNENGNKTQLNGGDCKMAVDGTDNGNSADQGGDQATGDKDQLAKAIKEEVDDGPQNTPVELTQVKKEEDEVSSTETIIEGMNDLDNNNDEEFEDEFVEELDEEYEEVMDVNEANGQELVEEEEMEVLDGEFVNQLLINLQADNEGQKSNDSAEDEDIEEEINQETNQVQNDEVEEEGFDVVDEA